MTCCKCGKRIPNVHTFRSVPLDSYELPDAPRTEMIKAAQQEVRESLSAFNKSLRQEGKNANVNNYLIGTFVAGVLATWNASKAALIIPLVTGAKPHTTLAAQQRLIADTAKGTVMYEERDRGRSLLVSAASNWLFASKNLVLQKVLDFTRFLAAKNNRGKKQAEAAK